MSNIAYIRVSAIDQNTDRQEIALSELNIDKYFTKKVSGKNADRPQLKKCLNMSGKVIQFLYKAFHV